MRSFCTVASYIALTICICCSIIVINTFIGAVMFEDTATVRAMRGYNIYAITFFFPVLSLVFAFVVSLLNDVKE